MKHIPFLFFFISISIFSQETYKTLFIKKTELKAKIIASVIKSNRYESIKYIDNNTLFVKLNENIIYNYSNLQLDEITSIDAFSPSKTKLFYKNFNTVVVLDNRLAEMDKVNFNTIKPYKNITHVTTSFGNKLWIFNQDTQQLELYNYKTGEVTAKSLPIQSNVVDLKSDYSYCWLLTENYLYKYDSLGSLIFKFENKGYTNITLDFKENFLLKSDKGLFYFRNYDQALIPIDTPKLLIKQFLVTNGSLYIYDDEFLHEYQLIKD
ncbi:hypothetical protein [Pontimicrobium sp. SW4]|uniref:Uncharacterized protein n=1 Tax=Pontimicrobium sp. SW4 TaxID=3153519 RepID=A0AAU7BR46_9FLAO